MDRKKIEEIIEKLNDMNTNYEDFEVALYIFARYGLHTFKYYIDDSELEEIKKIIKKSETLFNDNINEEVEKLLEVED